MPFVLFFARTIESMNLLPRDPYRLRTPLNAFSVLVKKKLLVSTPTLGRFVALFGRNLGKNDGYMCGRTLVTSALHFRTYVPDRALFSLWNPRVVQAFTRSKIRNAVGVG